MSAMRAKNLIFPLEIRRNPNSNGFLSYISMTRSMNQSTLVGFRQPFFANPDQHHAPIKFHRLCTFFLHRTRRVTYGC
jgi:hypothetical protein